MHVDDDIIYAIMLRLCLHYMLFSYQTGYIMWHSRLRIYIPRGAAEGNIAGNVTLYTLSDSWITDIQHNSQKKKDKQHNSQKKKDKQQ